MTDLARELLSQVAGSPLLQALVAALSTFVLEDPTTIGCGLLVAEQRMSFAVALAGVATGIAVGDLGLYGIGRLLGPHLTSRGWVSQEKIDRAAGWLRRNLVAAVVLCRFIPGMRLPAYLGAGLLKAPLGQFALVVVAASLVWTYLLLEVTVAMGETVWPLLGRFRWPVAAVVVTLLVLVQRRAASRFRDDEQERVVSHFELWPPWLFYPPVLLYSLWLAVRHRGLALPTVANPSIYSGGLVGESKSQILDLVPPPQRRWLAPYVVVEHPAEQPPMPPLLTRIEQQMADAGITYPVVAKPDIGQRGAGVWPISDRQQLAAYLACFPPGARLLVQEQVGAQTDDPNPKAAANPAVPTELEQAREAGILYWRLPGEAHGTIFSITLKLFPAVVGDGEHTVAELIDQDRRARLLRDLYRARHQELLATVPAAGQRFPLVFAGNHCQGTIFKDGTGLLTEALAKRIDEICRSIPGFYFGRLDLLFDDAEALLAGNGFKIVEINGASAEATHIWDKSMTLGGAYRVLFAQLRTLYAIGAANRDRGHQPLPLATVLRDLLRYRRLARTYPETR